MEWYWIYIVSVMIFLYIKGHSLFDMSVSSVCEESYYIQNKAGTEVYNVKINKTSYNCPALPSTNTGITDNHIVSEIKPHYSLFYNRNSKQVEANISWEQSVDMTYTSGYILQVHRTDPLGKEIKKCLKIEVSKETGYFYGNRNFPTSIRVTCFQVVSSTDEVLYISIWPIMSKNCNCQSEKTKREPVCSRRCRNQEEINTVSYNFPFVHDACNYWSQYRPPKLDLLIKVKRKFDVYAHILATNVNPYTSITFALFASDNPLFPLFEIHRTASTSLRFSKKIDHFENTTFYAVIYYFCNGSNSSATMSYMTPDVEIHSGKPDSGEWHQQDESDITLDNKKNNYILLSVLIGVTCIALGSVIAGFIVFRNKLGCRQTTPLQDGSRETMLASPDNNITAIEESIYQPTVRFQTDPEDIKFDIKDKHCI